MAAQISHRAGGRVGGRWLRPQLLVVFRHSGHDDKANPSFLRLKVILLGCAAADLLYAVLAVGCENLCLPKSDVTQRALLSAGYGEDYVSCPQLRVNERVERYPVSQN